MVGCSGPGGVEETTFVVLDRKSAVSVGGKRTLVVPPSQLTESSQLFATFCDAHKQHCHNGRRLSGNRGTSAASIIRSIGSKMVKLRVNKELRWGWCKNKKVELNVNGKGVETS